MEGFQDRIAGLQILNGQVPAYIADLLQPYDPPRKLHSAKKQLLSFEIIWWLCILLCSPSCMEQYPSQYENCQECW